MTSTIRIRRVPSLPLAAADHGGGRALPPKQVRRLHPFFNELPNEVGN